MFQNIQGSSTACIQSRLAAESARRAHISRRRYDSSFFYDEMLVCRFQNKDLKPSRYRYMLQRSGDG